MTALDDCASPLQELYDGIVEPRPSLRRRYDAELRMFVRRCFECLGAGSFAVFGEEHLREPCCCPDGWWRFSWAEVRRDRRARRRALMRIARVT